MTAIRSLAPFIAAMTVVVVASNILVQYPVQAAAWRRESGRIADLGRVHLSGRVSGHRPHQPHLWPRTRAAGRGSRFRARRGSIDLAGHTPHRHRIRQRVSNGAIARRIRLRPVAERSLVARAVRVQPAGLGARYAPVLCTRLRSGLCHARFRRRIRFARFCRAIAGCRRVGAPLGFSRLWRLSGESARGRGDAGALRLVRAAGRAAEELA